MAEVFDSDDPEGTKLTEEHIKRIRWIAKKVKELLPYIRMPVDPKVYPLLEVVIDMLETQIDIELHYTYDDDVSEDTGEKEVKKPEKEVKKPKSNQKQSKDIPDAEDLKDWFDGV